MASNNRNSGCALLIISIQLYFGTIMRRLRFARPAPYSPRFSIRRIGRRHGLSAGSEMISRSLRDKPDTTFRTGSVVLRSPKQRLQTRCDDALIRLSIFVSPRISEMSSTGRDSKVNMVVADAEVGDSTHHASQFLSPACAPS